MSGPARFVLVTGTDTGVGKTLVGCGLGRCLARRGVAVVAVKPVESGCAGRPAEEEDGALLARATGQGEPAAALVRLSAPVAPPAAAEREGIVLDPREWCRRIRELGRGRAVVLVEGAGGIRSPLTWELSSRDLAVALGAEALVVAPDRLGCLNHALLTLLAVREAGLGLLGVVLGAPETPDESTGTNAPALRRLAGTARVVSLPRVRNHEEAADRLEAVAAWLSG